MSKKVREQEARAVHTQAQTQTQIERERTTEKKCTHRMWPTLCLDTQINIFIKHNLIDIYT